MKKTLKKYIYVLICLCILRQSNAAPGDKSSRVEDSKPDVINRCNPFDSINGGEESKIIGRYNWTLKCFRTEFMNLDLNPEYNLNRHIDGRQLYPSFGRSYYDSSTKKYTFELIEAPTDENASCEVIPKSEGWKILWMCAQGCYTPDQYLLVEKGYKQINKLNKTNDHIYTLNKHSTLQKLEYRLQNIESIIKDATDSKQEILNFTLSTGANLKVTLNHPLVDKSGIVKEARMFKVNEHFVDEKGMPVEIYEIKKENYFGKVYNVDLASDVHEENLILAQGVLNGSIKYQNEWAKQMNRIILRSIIPQNL